MMPWRMAVLCVGLAACERAPTTCDNLCGAPGGKSISAGYSYDVCLCGNGRMVKANYSATSPNSLLIWTNAKDTP